MSETRARIGMLALSAAAAVLSLLILKAGREDWWVFGVLYLGAALAAYCSSNPVTNAPSQVTNVLLVVGSLVLPIHLSALLPVLVLLPPALWHRGITPPAIPWIHKVAHSTLGVILAGNWARLITAGGFGEWGDLAAVAGGALIFTCVQAALMWATVRNRRYGVIPVTIPSVYRDGLVNLVGALAAGTWASKPVLLVLAPAALYLVHKITRNAYLADLAEIDAKTGLYNSRYFERLMEEHLAQSRKLHRPLALLFVDMDLLREINNRHGHLVGDRVLQAVAGLLSRAIRSGDVAARFGGEEFVILLPDSNPQQAAYLAEQIRSEVAAHRLLLEDGSEVRCTVSIGVAAYPWDGPDAASLIQQADGAMYRAKRTRNTVAQSPGMNSIPRSPSNARQPQVPDPAPMRLALAPLVLWSTVFLGFLGLGWSLFSLLRTDSWLTMVPLVFLAVAGGLIRAQVYESNRQKITLSFTGVVTMTAVTVLPMGAPLVNLVGSLVHVIAQRQKKLDKWLFNLGNHALASAVTALIYLLLAPPQGHFSARGLVAAAVAVVTYQAVNLGILALMISLHSGRPLKTLVLEMAWSTPTSVVLGLTGAFLGSFHQELGLIGSLMFVAPLLILRYSLQLYAKKSEESIAGLEKAKALVEEANRKQVQTMESLIETLSAITDARDNSTYGHSRQVARYAVALGEEMKLDRAELDALYTAGLLHDLGKMGVPELILLKPGRLTPEEYGIVKRHAFLGGKILAEVPGLKNIASMVAEHHERYDGTGYPTGHSGERISIEGRILAVADTLDSIISDRPYRKGSSLLVALKELDRCAGTQFDPAIVAAIHRLAESRPPEFFANSAQESNLKWLGAGENHDIGCREGNVSPVTQFAD